MAIRRRSGASRWTIVLFPVVLLGLVLAFWIHGQLPVGTYWKAGLVLLIALEIGYGVCTSVAVLAALLLVVLMLLRRRSGRTGALLARPLLVCASVLLAAVVAEAGCAVHRILTPSKSEEPAGRSIASRLVDVGKRH